MNLSREDCQRKKCLLCETKKYTGKYLTQECSRRNLVYETRCITCEEREIEKIEKETVGDEEKRKERKRKMKLYKYVGETACSTFERAWEHQNDIDQLKHSSHLLQHLMDAHEEEDMESIRFRVRVIKFTKSSFLIE